MAVNVKREFNLFLAQINSRYKNRLRLGLSGYSQLFFYSFLFCYPSFSYATPDLRGVVGGNAAATVNTQGLTTNVNQFQSSVIIDWNSLNLAADEKLAIHQLSTDTLLNRIHSSTATDIYGQITGAGTNLFVNPNGVFFRPGSRVDVGALIASGLQISNSDFLNGDYIFNEVMGTDGFVINSGLINASLGGSATLLGKSVTNDGVISAQLGSVNLAAGKAAVLTFDQQGLLGVQVTEAILQDELGIDPAVLNSGEINAEGGKVLLTASVSQDVFSQAVNSGDIEQATSVVVNEDGTFTLGAGADVVNTGTVDVSTSEATQKAGQVVMLGENVTSSGLINANANNANGGDIELHATETTLLTENSLTSARSESNGKGGVIKILGDKVGLIDQTTVDASGSLGGGQVLIGGDYQGKNTQIRNANFSYIGKDVKTYSDALDNGNAGKIINWADNSTLFYGSAFARGGRFSGDGGLVEVSGKNYLAFRGDVNTTAINGKIGQLLLDPVDINIRAGTGDGASDGDNTFNGQYIQGGLRNRVAGDVRYTDDLPLGTNSPSIIYESELEALSASTNIRVEASNNIIIEDLSPNVGDDGILLLNMSGFDATDTGGTVTFLADGDGDGNGLFRMDDITNTIKTLGGEVNIQGASVVVGNIETFTANQTSGYVNITATTSSLSVASIDTTGTAGASDVNGRNGGNVTLSSFTDITTGAITTDGGAGGTGDTSGGNAGFISLTSGEVATAGSEDRINLNGNLSAVGGAKNGGGTDGASASIFLDTPLIVTNAVRTIGGGNVGFFDEFGGFFFRNKLSLGASLTITAGANADIFLRTNIDFNGIGTGTNNLILNAGNDITLFEIRDSVTGTDDILNISLNADQDNDNASFLNLLENISTRNGSFTATGASFISESYDNSGTVNVTINTGTGLADIDMSTSVLLGGMTVGGTLDIKAGTSITQGTLDAANDVLVVDGVTTISTTGTTDTDDIILTNNNQLNNAVNLHTNFDVDSVISPSANIFQSDISLTNISTTTNINDINVSGELVVNADKNLTVTGAISGYSEDGDNGNDATNTLELNFGQDGTASTFTSTGATIASANASGSGDRINVDINGGTNNDTFDIDNAIFNQAGFSQTRDIVIDGKEGNDTFNIATDIAGSNRGEVKGDIGNDIFNINTGTTEIERLRGDEGTDTFNINTTAEITLSDLRGGADNDTLVGANRVNNWELTNNDRGKLNEITSPASGIDFREIENLTGNDSTDDFVITSGTLTGSIIGGTGNDSLTGSNNAQTWEITGNNSGNVDIDINGTFSGIESLIGNANVDTFQINGGTLSGGIDGQGNDDILEVGASTTADKTWTITAQNTGTMTDLNTGAVDASGFVNVETLTGGDGSDSFTIESAGSLTGALNGGGSTGVDVLIGRDEESIWTITSQGVGSITDAALTKYIAGDFTGIENFTGGTAKDTFVFSDTGVGAGGSLINQINGGGGTGINILQATNANNNDWTIDGVNSGNVSDATGSIVAGYQSIQELVGHTASDTFTFTANGTATPLINSITGGSTSGNELISANTNDNSWNITDANQGSVNDTAGTIVTSFIQVQSLSGGDASDTFTLGLTGSLSGAITGGAGTGVDELVGKNQSNIWIIDSPNEGNISDNPLTANYITGGFSEIENLTGGTAADTFNFIGAGSLTGLLDGNSGTGTDDIQYFTDISEVAAAHDSIQLGSTPVTVNLYTNNLLDVANIEQIDANTINSNTIIGATTDQNWLLTGADSGVIVDTTVTTPPAISENSVTYSAFQNLVGGDSIDNFIVQSDAATTRGLILGGLGADTFNLSMITTAAVVQLGLTVNSAANVTLDGIEVVTANAGVALNEIIADSSVLNNNWDITADKAGTINTSAYVTFNNFDQLTGGTSVDRFLISATNLTSALIIDGGATAAYGDSPTTFDTLIAPNLDNPIPDLANPEGFATQWIIDATAPSNTLTSLNSSNVINISFNNIENLTGGSGNDNFVFNSLVIGLVSGGGEFIDRANNIVGDQVNYSAVTGDVALEYVTVLPDPVLLTNPVSLYVNDIENIAGNGGAFIGANAYNVWVIDGVDSGFVTSGGQTTYFTGYTSLTGNDGVDEFTISNDGGATTSGSLSGTISGGGTASIDVLTVNYNTGVNTAWSITDVNQGSVDGINGGLADGFNGIESIVAGAQNDTFNFGVNGVFDGNINAGAGTDIINLSLLNDIIFDLASGFSGRQLFEEVVGNNTTSTIAGDDIGNIWNIDGDNTGTIGSLRFRDFNNITGGNAADTFEFDTLGNITGLINGGSGTGNDIIQLAVGNTTGFDVQMVLSTLPILVGNDANNRLDIINIEQVDLSLASAPSTFYSSNEDTTWLLSGTNNGFLSVSDSLTTVPTGNAEGITQFNNFSILNGGTAADTFRVNGGTVTGSVIGGGGSDEIIVTASGNSWQLTSDNVGSLNASLAFSSIENLTGNNDTLTGPSATNTWTITEITAGNPIGDLNNNLDFTGMTTVTGGGLDDTFDLSSAVTAGTYNGGTAGNDIINRLNGVNVWLLSTDNNGTLNTTINFNGIDEINGNNGTLTGPSLSNNTWTITEAVAGSPIGDLNNNLDFSGIGTVNGGSLDDTFDLASTVTVGTYNGGTAGNDIINRLSGANVWLLSTDNNGTLNTTVSFSGIDEINGNNGSLTGPSVSNNTWTITEAVAGSPIGDLNNNLDFTGISTVTGGSLDDTFDLASTVTAGTYNGGTAGNDIINRLSGANVWLLSTDNNGTLNATISFADIDEINGNNGSLTGPSVGNNIWGITEAIAGSPTGILNSNLDISGISTFTGGSLVDTFNLGSNVSTGSYNGGTGGRDIINRLTGANTWQLTTDNNGTLNAVISFNDIDVINGNNGTLTVHSLSSNMWNITSDYAGDINSSMEFTSMTQMNGGTSADTFSLSRAVANGSFNGGATTSIDTIMLATEAGITDADTNAWDVTGDGTGTIKGTSFTAMETLTGNDGIDNFTLSTNLFSGTINGGANIDSLSAFTDDNTWVINDVDSGTLTSDASMITASFEIIENLIGNTNEDTFSVTDAGSLSGTIDGGTGINDSINLAAKATGISVQLGSSLASINADLTAIDMFNTNNIETVTAPVPTAEGVMPVITNTIIGADVDQIFIIDGANSGAVGPVALVDSDTGLFPVGDTDGVTRFNNFDNIQGGIFADIFRIVDGGSFGSIDGGTHPDDLPGPPVQIDTIDLNSTGVIDLAVGDTSAFGSGVTNVEGINGNSTQSILRASDAGSVWTINGVNSGTVVSDGNTTNFTGFNILQGGAGVDTFNITSTGAVGDQSAVDTVSRLSGGGGDDQLNVDLSGGNAKINLFTADGLTTSDLNNNTIAFSTEATNPGSADRVNITGISAGFDTATYSVDYATGIATHTYENTLTPATASVAYTGVTRTTGPNPTVVVDAVQANNLIISGTNDNTNSNIVTITGNGEGAGNFDLSRSTTNPIDWADVDYSNKQSLTVRNLGIGGTITAMSNIDVNTTSGFIDFSASNINTANRTLTANELRLDSVTGDIASNSPILTDVNNLQVTSSSANIYISENSGLNLVQVDTTGLLSIIADGTITDDTTQALTSSGNLSLRTINNNANDIIIDNALNNLTGTISLNTEDGATATLVNAGSETLLGASSVGLTGTLNVTSTNGSITSTETIIAGTFNLSSSADINLTNAANDFTTLSIATAVSADIHDTNDLILGNVSIDAGTLQITADSIDQVNGTSIIQTPNLFDGSAGNITFNIGAGIIDLGNLTNDFIGDVALNNSGEFFVEIADVNDIQFGASNIGSGTFTVNSNGLVSQSGRISQETPANINTSAVAINAGIGEIDLTNINNNFTGTINLVNTSNATVALTNLNNIVLDGANVGGQFNMTARGGFDISQVAPLTVVGNASFTVDAGRSIILDDNMNDLQGGVSFNSNNGLALFDVTIFNNRALELGDINVSNNLDVLANGEITNTGVLTVGEVAWLDATNNNITVDNPSNNFNNIVLLNANTVIVNDVDGINIGSSIAGRTDSTIATDLNVTTTTGDITDVANATLTVGGVTNLSAGSLANAGNIQLDETSNEFNQVNILNAQDVTLFDLDTDANGIDLRSNLIAGNLAVTSTGDITNSNNALSGALVVNGTSSFTTADAGEIQLTNSANALTGALTFTATTNGVALNNVGIVNTLATNINALNISTDLDIISGGAITQNAAFTVGNLTTLDAINTSTMVAQDIILDSPNNLNLVTILNANNVTINNATNTLSVDQLNAAGAIDIMSGALTIADDIVASSVALDSGAGLTSIASVNTAGSLSINSEGLTVSGTVDAGDAIIDAGGAAAAFLGDITTGTTLDITANGLTLNGAIQTGGNAVLDATTGVANLNNSITVSAGDLTVSGNGINQPDNILVQNDVLFNSTQGIAMDAASSTTATDGSIQYNADNTVNVGLLSAVNGTAGVNTSADIVDANGDLVNFLATNMVTRTGSGVGSEANPIETQVSTLDVINSGSGSVWIDQSGAGDLEIIALQNDAVRTSVGDPGGTTNIRADESFLINPNSVAVDRDTGILFMTSENGGFSGTGLFIPGTDPVTDPDGSLINPDFTGNQVTFFALNGDFGSSFRPLVLDVPKLNNSIPGENSFIFIDSVRVAARYFPDEPDNLTTTGIDVSALGVLSAIAGELLVEVETLGDIDPAIFTDLQNYSLQDISIRMPRDQLFEDELEEDGRLQ